jgi:hypothetical protein
VYTNGDSAELFLNGKSLGRRRKATSVPRRVNVAEGKAATASSTRGDRFSPGQATDDRNWTRWRADQNVPGQWWQVDLGVVQPVRDVVLAFDGPAQNYQYRIMTSGDGADWKTFAEQNKFVQNAGDRLAHGGEADARYIRVEFTRLRDGRTGVGLRDVFVYPVSYFAVTDKYRLKWMDVVYEPGELKAVAYKGDSRIGEAVMRTAGPPAAIRLAPDRTQLAASGDDLCYVTAEAVDADGTLCPLADNLVRFAVEGPAEIVAVGNGNPMSQEPFQARERKLFFGKAMLILRISEGNGGEIRVSATSDGLAAANVSCRATPP